MNKNDEGQNTSFYEKMRTLDEMYDQTKIKTIKQLSRSFWGQIWVSIVSLILIFLLILIALFVSFALFTVVGIFGLCYLINSLVLSIRILANDYGFSKIENMKKLWGLLSLLWFPSLLYQIIFVVKSSRIIKFYDSATIF